VAWIAASTVSTTSGRRKHSTKSVTVSRRLPDGRSRSLRFEEPPDTVCILWLFCDESGHHDPAFASRGLGYRLNPGIAGPPAVAVL